MNSHMKKIVIIIAMAVAAIPAMAQDTVSGAALFENYFYRMGFHPDSSQFPMEIAHNLGITGGEIMFLCNTDDTIAVYGIAAILSNPKEHSFAWWLAADTTEAGANSYLRLYLPSADSAICVRQVMVNPFTTPTAYFVNFAGYPTSDRHYMERMVEQTFDEPILVHGRFYVGKTCYGTTGVTRYDDNGDPYTIDTHLEGHMGQINLPKDTYDSLMFYVPYHRGQKWLKDRKNRYTIMYPMIMPPDSVGTDTVTTPINLVERMTGISPNPTSGLAKVLSSSGIIKVEAYDMSGARIATLLPAEGSSRPLSMTVDTRRWPVGAYILRIHTPMGVATKKLTVVR